MIALKKISMEDYGKAVAEAAMQVRVQVFNTQSTWTITVRGDVFLCHTINPGIYEMQEDNLYFCGNEPETKAKIQDIVFDETGYTEWREIKVKRAIRTYPKSEAPQMIQIT